jgi:hypothetical protein
MLYFITVLKFFAGSTENERANELEKVEKALKIV